MDHDVELGASGEDEPVIGQVLVAIPAFGAPELTDRVLGDLLAAPRRLVLGTHVVVVDNGDDYSPGEAVRGDPRLEIYRPGSNLRWIRSANWALDRAAATGADVCLVLNNDVRLSPDFLYRLIRTFTDCAGVGVAAPCYDDFWLHQRARSIPAAAGQFRPTHSYRSVPFCDGTAWAVSTAAAQTVGRLDTEHFPRHGYGSDLDFALRVQEAGLRSVVTDAAYVSHLRRGTMDRLPEETRERNRAEILTGMNARWGDSWRERLGLGAGAFPPHNTGSAVSWYSTDRFASEPLGPADGRAFIGRRPAPGCGRVAGTPVACVPLRAAGDRRVLCRTGSGRHDRTRCRRVRPANANASR